MKLSFMFFWKNLLLNILIVAQICASAVFGMISSSVISKSYLYYNLTKSLNSAYAYMPESEDSYYSDSAISKYVKSGEINLSRSRNRDISNYNINATNPTEASKICGYFFSHVYTFGKISSESMKSQLKKGKWFSDEVQDDIIECVIISTNHDFPIGMIIEGAEYNFIFNFEGPTPTVKYEVINKYKFKVVGTLGQSAEILEFSSSPYPAYGLELNNLFNTVSYKKINYFENLSSRDPFKDKQNSEQKPALTILCSNKAFSDSQLEEQSEKSSYKNALFEFADNVSEERKKEILTELQYEAGVIDIASRREIALAEAKNKVAEYLPILLCFISMVVVGVISVAVLSMIKNMQIFKTYIYTGMSFWQGAKILLEYTLMILVLAAIFTSLSWWLLALFRKIPWYSMDFGAHSILFAVATFVVSGIIIMAISLSLLKKYEKGGVEK